MNESQVLTVTLWGLGICVTGFLFLAGWILKIQIELKEKVDFKWLEGHFEKEVKYELKEIAESVKEIKEALVGTVERKGIVTRINDIEKGCKSLNP